MRALTKWWMLNKMLATLQESEHNQAPLETANEMNIVYDEFAGAFCKAVESEKLDANVEWRYSHIDQVDIRNNVYDAEMVEDHYGESDEENEEDEDEDEDVGANPDAARKDGPISKCLSKIQAGLCEQKYSEVYKNGSSGSYLQCPFRPQKETGSNNLPSSSGVPLDAAYFDTQMP
ncbi:hypothetical protein BJV82DRAFT_670987 [Fennellomyces sp. T-0311]|nr:hypothetical protein BJV82DRAFT_670987 [Fennellomyces sp. T-0311]